MRYTSRLAAIVAVVFATLAIPDTTRAQTQINPLTQVNWSALAGSGAPTTGCPTSTSGSTTTGSATVTVASLVGITVNQTVTGTGVQTGSIVSAINGTLSTVTLSQPATATGSSVSLGFYAIGRTYVDVTNNLGYFCTGGGWTANSGSSSAVATTLNTSNTELPLALLQSAASSTGQDVQVGSLGPTVNPSTGGLTASAVSSTAAGCGSADPLLRYDGTCSSAVTQIIAGTNVSISPSGGTGAVTISSTASGGVTSITTTGYTGPAQLTGSSLNIPQYSTVPYNATFAFTGESQNDDDTNAIETTAIPISAITCNGTTCTVTNTGTNGLKAGDWVNMRFSTSDFAAGNAHLPSTISLETGGTVFQVLSTGLSTTQFEFNYTLASPTCASSCGNAYLANYNLPFATVNQGALAGKGTVVMKLPNPVNIAGLAANYSSMFHSISPAVTGTPGYLFIDGLTNELVPSGCSTGTVTTLEANLQSIWSAAHTDGWTVVMGSMNAIWVDEFGSSCTQFYPLYSSLSQWLYNQGKSASNAASGQYWDRMADIQHVVDDAQDTQLVASNGGFGPTGAALASAKLAESVTDNTSVVQQHRGNLFGFPVANMGGIAGVAGQVFVPHTDSSSAWCFANAAMTQIVMCLDSSGPSFTANGHGEIDGNRNQAINGIPVWTLKNAPDQPVPVVARSWTSFTPNVSNAGSVWNYLWDTWGYDGGNYDGMDFGFNYSQSGSSTLNFPMLHIFGDTRDVFHGASNGRICFGVPTASGSTPGQVGCPSPAALSVGPTAQYQVSTSGQAVLSNLPYNVMPYQTAQFGSGLPSAQATPTLVQSGSNTSNGAVTLGSSVQQGHVLVVSITVPAGQTATVTDTLGTSYTQEVRYAPGAGTTMIFVGIAPSGGSDTVTATSTNGSAINVVAEFSGVSGALDGAAQTGSTSGTTSSTLNLTTTGTNDLLLANLYMDASSGCPVTLNSGWTVGNCLVNTKGGAFGYEVAATAGAYSSTWTLSSSMSNVNTMLALTGTTNAPYSYNGAVYYDTSTTPYVKYVYHGGAWQAVGSGGAALDLSNLASPTAINDTTLTFSGAGGLAAGGTNQSILLNPTGTGVVSLTHYDGSTFYGQINLGPVGNQVSIAEYNTGLGSLRLIGHNDVSITVDTGNTVFIGTGTGYVHSYGGQTYVAANVASSATPVFDARLGRIFTTTMSTSITSCTTPNALVGLIATFDFIENGTGGFTVTCSILHGLGTVTTTANEHNVQTFYYDGTNWQAIDAMYSHL